MQNGREKSFHGRLRDECLNANWFRTFDHVRLTLGSGAWSTTRNGHAPHWTTAPERVR